MSALLCELSAAPITPADRAMLHYAWRLTIDPAGITETDVELLRSSGFSDAAIHDIAAVAAYFNFVNRIALGLGVELEPHLR